MRAERRRCADAFRRARQNLHAYYWHGDKCDCLFGNIAQVERV